MSTEKTVPRLLGASARKLWRHQVDRDKKLRIESPMDYYEMVDRHDSLRKHTATYRSAKEEAIKSTEKDVNTTKKVMKRKLLPLRKAAAKHYGVVARAVCKDFIRMVDFKDDAPRPAKYELIKRAKEYTSRYQAVSNSMAEADRRLAFKAMKHVNVRLDPRTAMTEAIGQGWMVARNKPGGDRTLKEAYKALQQAKTDAHKDIKVALSRPATAPVSSAE